MQTLDVTEGLTLARKLFSALEEQGVRHCHWKSNQHLYEALAGITDLDVLVDRQQASLCEHVLTGLGYKRLTSQSGSSYPGIEDWLGLDEQSGALSHLHLHYQLVSGRRFVKEQRLPWERLILGSAVKDPEFDVFVTDPSLELVLLCVRIGLKTRRAAILRGYVGDHRVLGKDLKAELDFLMDRAEARQVSRYADKLLGEHGAELVRLVFSGTLTQPRTLLALRSLARAALRPYRRYSEAVTVGMAYRHYLGRKGGALARRLGRPARQGKRLSNGGVLIALIGADGAGKSTVSLELQRWLAWKLEVHRLYLGSGDGPTGLLTGFRRALTRRLRRRPPTDPAERSTAASRVATPETAPAKGAAAKRPGSPLKTLIGACFDLALARERRRKLAAARRLAVEGAVVITDRYPQSQFPGIYDGPKLGLKASAMPHVGLLKRLSALEARAYREMARFPPDLVIKLLLPAEVALARKPNGTPETVMTKAKITEELYLEGAKVIGVNAADNLDEVLRTVKREVWRHL